MTIVGDLRTRLRAEGTVGLSDALCLTVLDYCQKMFNARYKRVLSSADITLDANTNLFAIRSKLTSPEAMNLVSVTVFGRTLNRLKDWRELFGYDRAWWGTTAARHEVWAQIGADKFVVYPTVATNVTATIVYAGQTTELNDTGDSFDLPAEDQDFVYGLATTILHLHRRNYAEANKELKKLQTQIADNPVGFPGTEL